MYKDPQRDRVCVSLRHLKLFESVARLQSVGRASEERHLSQPAVTEAIAKLEEQVGAVLLDRRASGTYLNEFGAIFYRRTLRVLEQIEQGLVELGVPAEPMPIPTVASRITRSKIRSLTAIVESGSFADAAVALGVSPVWLQRAARDLERTLRVPLFTQSVSGLVATPAAAEFARKLKLAVRELEAAIDELQAARGCGRGEIVVGAMLLAGSAVLGSALNEFALSHPNAGIRVVTGRAGDLLSSLRAGDVDIVIGLLPDPTPPNLVSQPLAQTPFVVAARRGHPLTHKTKITLDDLASYEWIVGTPGARRRAHFEKLFEQRNPPRARLAIGPLPIIRMMLAQNDYLTLLTTYQVLQEEDALTALPFRPIEPAQSIGLTMRDNWLPTQLQADFIALVQKRVVGLMATTEELKRAS